MFSEIHVTPDADALLACIARRGTPKRVHNIELFLDAEVQDAIVERFGLGRDLNPDAPEFGYRRQIALQRFLGYDYVRSALDGIEWVFNREIVGDTAALSRSAGRRYINEHSGPITSWAEFESYPWPRPEQWSTRSLEWYERNLPDDMCVIGSGGFAHFAEHLCWLMGYEHLCIALYEQRDLVAAIRDRLIDLYRGMLATLLQFSRMRIIWGSDDMGFKTGPLISPDDLREFVLPGHRLMSEMSHAAGRPYLLHSCGKLDSIMPDLLDNVGIDAKHSFEDVIEDVRDAKRAYGDRLALLGGIDMDLLCRGTEQQVRERVREVLEACMPGGGYCLGTGNSVANYVPIGNYLAMLDEGRRFRPVIAMDTDPTKCAYAPPGEYAKDHTLIFHDGWWHLFSISGTAGYYHGYNGNEETFSWSISRDLVNWEFRGHVMHPSQRPGTFDQHEVWAPNCLKANGRFYMFYTGIIHPHRPMEYRRLGAGHPWVHQGHRETQGLAVSEDLTDWVKVDDPQKGLSIPGRDSHVVRDEANDRWLLYSTGQGSEGMDDAYVSESRDLLHWRYIGVCARFPKLDATRNYGSTVESWPGFRKWTITTESLFVMKHPTSGRWILLANWQYAVSDNPTDFTRSEVRPYDNTFDGRPVDMGFACEIVPHDGRWYRSGVFGEVDHWRLGFTEIDWRPEGAFAISIPSVLG